MPLSQDEATRLGVAATLAAMARALSATSPKFEERFEAALKEVYYQLREAESPTIGAMETVKWTGELFRKTKP